jgi:hypothetical protein
MVGERVLESGEVLLDGRLVIAASLEDEDYPGSSGTLTVPATARRPEPSVTSCSSKRSTSA